ncbi:unnamed protein product [Rotaria magnacalcarata]|uniref:Uncharacterized protein n=2 Tax=Rotaria magnacalcarata TaxID=392030 RepID=A0A816Z1T7_9BILA|nr:unnamed protein product [Rotaria magnacalcarata]
MELLKDNPDNDTLNDLWTQSFNIRRLCIRELSIDEILQRFPGYCRPELILAEVKDTVGVDINKNTNDLLPKFFDCIPDNGCFLSDILPFRIIRILCKIFSDSVANIFTYEDILVPYPCIKIFDDKFEIYVDFHLITETLSSSTALALLISMYHIFELKFAHHNRCCRLLYSVLLEDSRHLNKSLKRLLNDWKYTINNQAIIKRQALITSIVQNLTPSSIVNRNISTTANTSNRGLLFIVTSVNELAHNHENSISSSDDEDEPRPLSIASPPNLTAKHEPSRSMLEIASKPTVTNKNLSNNTKSTQSTSISSSKKLVPAHEQENAIDKTRQTKKTLPLVSRKRKPEANSSANIITSKQSQRLAAKRIRLN